MALSLKPQHVSRYRDIARLFLKYGRGDLLRNSGIDDVEPESPAATATTSTTGNGAGGDVPPGDRADSLTRVASEDLAHKAEQLAEDLEKLGPTYVKVGQFLSTRADFLPPAYIEALARLQDRVEAVPFEEIERIVSEELGVRMSKAFATFEDIPVASASLGQVHRAELRDGRAVAVKVQRPNIREKVREDLEALGEVAEFLDAHSELGRKQSFAAMLEEFRKSLMRELDYRQEARHLSLLADHMQDLDLILVPRPVDDYVTSRILTMEFVEGRKVTAMGPLAKMELDGAPLAEALCRAYLKQILVDGFFHADPHPGNVLVTDDGRLALIDLGMVAQVAPSMQEELLKLVLAVSEGRGEDAADLVVRIGRPLEDAEPGIVRRRIIEMVLGFQGMRMKDLALGRFLFEAAHTASEAGYRMPRELTMLSKALLNVDQVARELDPTFDPNESIRRQAADLMRQRMMKSLSPGKLFAGLLEAKGFAENLPRRLNELVDAIAENRVRFQVDALDEVLLMEGLQKIANRITMGLIIAAMIVGAALLMRVETSFRILGYPGLAIVFFLAAAVTGLALVFNIVLHDLKAEKERVRAQQKKKLVRPDTAA
jgi:predicted unusual protein kinase regulating ubiquinone biosynthesis (AarF/ABC1/UbiB family)